MSAEQGVSLWQRMFPPTPNFLAMLGAQLNHGRQALDAFLQWCDAPSDATVEAVFQIEKEADDTRLKLVLALSHAFDTPLDREDLDDLSQRLDDIVDQVRNSVREGTALRVTPDDAIRKMIANLQGALSDLQKAIGALPKDRHGAIHHATTARHSQRLNERIYTEALAKIVESEDFRTIFRQREAYRLIIRLSELVELSSEELEHAVNKLG